MQQAVYWTEQNMAYFKTKSFKQLLAHLNLN
jgi:hypothetical protein